MIYFVRAAEVGRIKIGHATDVRSRLSELRTSSPVVLELMGVMPGGFVEERELHDRFADCRWVREWYSETPELLAYIGEHARPLAGRDRPGTRRTCPRVYSILFYDDMIERIWKDMPTAEEIALVTDDQIDALPEVWIDLFRRLSGTGDWREFARQMMVRWKKNGVDPHSPVRFDLA